MRQLSSELLISPPLRYGENQEFETDALRALLNCRIRQHLLDERKGGNIICDRVERKHAVDMIDKRTIKPMCKGKENIVGTETIWVNGKDKIRFNDDTNTYRFVADDKDVINITMDGDNTVIVLQGHGTIHSNGDLRIHLDENQATAPTVAKLKVFNGSNSEIFSVNEQGEVDIHAGQITTRIVPLAGATGSDDILTIGTGLPATRRGRVAVRNQPEVTQEFPQPRKAGILVLYDEGGRENFLWVDSNGKLRISRSDPGADDLSGTIVGTQG
jgi:hypothetical protein